MSIVVFFSWARRRFLSRDGVPGGFIDLILQPLQPFSRGLSQLFAYSGSIDSRHVILDQRIRVKKRGFDSVGFGRAHR